MEEMQKAERFALRKLLENYKNVVAQRDLLLVKQKDYIAKISSIEETVGIQMRNAGEIASQCQEKERSIRELENLLRENQHSLSMSHAEIEKYRNTIENLASKLKQVCK